MQLFTYVALHPGLEISRLTRQQMSEEIANASVNVPRSMMASVLLNGTLGFAMLVAVLFCLGNVEDIIETPTGYPFLAIFQNGVSSIGGASTMGAIVAVLGVCATIAFVATSSRMTWSFARDHGLPFWKYLSKVSHTPHDFLTKKYVSPSP